MNIFYLDEDPKLAAQYQCDKHVVKMILETAQILSTVYHQNCVNPPDFLYKATHKNHPCVLWAGRCRENFEWLVRHGLELCNEYKYRYGKTHKSRDVIAKIAVSIEFLKLPRLGNITEVAQAMPESCRRKDGVAAYRNYYVAEKLPNIQCRWTKREKPSWLES